MSREKLQRDEKEAELNKSLEVAHKRGDKLEAELAAVAADAASLREKLLAAQNGAADAAVEAEDLVASKAAEIASLVASLENIKGDLAKRDEDLDTLRDELKSTAETAEKLTAGLEQEKIEREEERAATAAELDRAKTEASENKGRADSLLEHQSTLMADIKEQRARVDKMEEERKNAVQAGASSLEEARAQAREDLLRAEERHKRDKEEAATAAAAALEAAKEKAAFEVQTARDGAAAGRDN